MYMFEEMEDEFNGHKQPTYPRHHHGHGGYNHGYNGTWYTEKEEASKTLSVVVGKLLDQYIGVPLAVFREKKPEINQKIMDIIKKTLEKSRFINTVDWNIIPESCYDDKGVAVLYAAHIDWKFV